MCLTSEDHVQNKGDRAKVEPRQIRASSSNTRDFSQDRCRARLGLGRTRPARQVCALHECLDSSGSREGGLVSSYVRSALQSAIEAMSLGERLLGAFESVLQGAVEGGVIF